MRRILKINTGRQPHEVFLILVTTLLGVIGTASPTIISEAIAAVFLPPWAMFYWISMAVTGGITLYGIFSRSIEGLLVERAGLLLQSTVLGVYVYAVMITAGSVGLPAVLLPLGIIIGHLARGLQITKRHIPMLQSYLKDHPGDQVR